MTAKQLQCNMFWIVLMTRLVHPNKAASILEADYHQKIVMKFQLKDKAGGQLMTAHQTFVRLTNQDTKQEIIFVTESDSTLTNKFDLVSNFAGLLKHW